VSTVAQIDTAQEAHSVIRDLFASLPLDTVSNVMFAALKDAGIPLSEIERLGMDLNHDAYMEGRT